MKKAIMCVLLVLSLAFAASAEGMLPQMFLASRGLMVLDQNQIESMGGSTSESELDYSYCGFSTSDSTPMIVWQDDMFYMAMEMSAMFGNPTMNAKGLSQVFIDFCRSYPDFEIYTCDGDIVYVRNTDTLNSLLTTADDIPSTICSSMDEFIEAVKEHVE